MDVKELQYILKKEAELIDRLHSCCYIDNELFDKIKSASNPGEAVSIAAVNLSEIFERVKKEFSHLFHVSISYSVEDTILKHKQRRYIDIVFNIKIYHKVPEFKDHLALNTEITIPFNIADKPINGEKWHLWICCENFKVDRNLAFRIYKKDWSESNAVLYVEYLPCPSLRFIFYEDYFDYHKMYKVSGAQAGYPTVNCLNLESHLLSGVHIHDDMDFEEEDGASRLLLGINK